MGSKSFENSEILVFGPINLYSEGLPPIVSALKANAELDTANFHFPSHNGGRAAPSLLTNLIGIAPFHHDLFEVSKLEHLFNLKRSILHAQKAAAELFGATDTWFLVGGTTCGIEAAIMATCSPGDLLILPRNSHISAISGLILCGAIPKYIIPEYNSDWEIASGVTPSQVEKAIKELDMECRKVSVVFVTSPTYHGICCDLTAIGILCHSRGIPLIVDEAHGAHFLLHSGLPSSALEQGADIAVRSTHKVLCSFSQSSMLHMSGNIVDRKKICRFLQVLQSTSPSYLLLAARAQLSGNPKSIFNEAVELALETKSLIKTIPGISVLEFLDFNGFTAIDHLRITVGVWKLGLSGYEADRLLENDRIIPELVGTQSLTFVMNMGTCREHAKRLIAGLECLSLKKSVKMENGKGAEHAPFMDIAIGLNPREAFFADKESVSINESHRKICGMLICPFPPGIPVLFPGELITEKTLSYLVDMKNMGEKLLEPRILCFLLLLIARNNCGDKDTGTKSDSE